MAKPATVRYRGNVVQLAGSPHQWSKAPGWTNEKGPPLYHCRLPNGLSNARCDERYGLAVDRHTLPPDCRLCRTCLDFVMEDRIKLLALDHTYAALAKNVAEMKALLLERKSALRGGFTDENQQLLDTCIETALVFTIKAQRCACAEIGYGTYLFNPKCKHCHGTGTAKPRSNQT